LNTLDFEEPDKALIRHENRIARLRTFRVGTERFGLFANEVAEVTRWRQPTPLPGAPEVIVGVVSVQARMITVLDTARILELQMEDVVNPDLVIALVGQEQLGLTATSEETALDIPISQMELSTHPGPLMGCVRQEGETIPILDPQQLFAAAIRGQERRRRQR
jgi:purine-binding chemotaxis protein CheW